MELTGGSQNTMVLTKEQQRIKALESAAIKAIEEGEDGIRRLIKGQHLIVNGNLVEILNALKGLFPDKYRKEGYQYVEINPKQEQQESSGDKYAFLLDGEKSDQYSGPYDSREEALKEAIIGHNLKPGRYVTIGTVVPYSYNVSASLIIDDMANDSCDRVGEAAESWPDFSKEEEESFERDLNAVVEHHIKRSKNEPHFFCVMDETTDGVLVTEELIHKYGGTNG